MSSAIQNSEGTKPVAPAVAPAAGAEGAWRNILPKEFQTHPAFTRYKDLASFAKGHTELEGILGNSVRIPGEKATDAERLEFYTKLGWPGAADKYELKFDEGTEVDEKLLSAFTLKANELHLPKGVVQELGKWWAEQAAGAQEGMATNLVAERAANHAAIQKEWGYTAERNLKLAARGLANLMGGAENPQKLLEDPLYKLLDERGITDNPLFLKMLVNFAAKSGEDQFLDAQNGPSESDLASANEEYNRTMNEPKKTSTYWNGELAGHAEAVKRMSHLREVIAAGNAAERG